MGKIHVVRAGSNMAYGTGTRQMFDNMEMKVCTVERKTCEFLEELFLHIMVQLQRQNKTARVSRDKKLRYLPFEMCVDLKSAINN